MFGERLRAILSGVKADRPGVVWRNGRDARKAARNSRAADQAPLRAVPVFDQRLIATRSAGACGCADRPDIRRCIN